MLITKLMLLKDYEGNKAGTVLEFEDSAEAQKKAQTLIDAGIAKTLGNKLKLLKSYDGKKIGDVIDIEDDEIFKGLISTGVGVEAEEDMGLEEGLKALEARLEKKYEAKLAKLLAKGSKSGLPGFSNVDVYENWQDDPKKGFSSFGTYAKSVHQASIGDGFTKELEQYQKAFGDGQNESIGAEGGLLVPPAFNLTIMEHPMVNASLDLTPLTSVVPVVGNSMSFIVADNSDQSATSTRFAGITSEWIKEGGTITGSKAKFETIELKLKKVVTMLFVTGELLEDSAIAIESYLSNRAGAAIVDTKNQGIISGLGVNDPLGYINSAGTVVITPTVARTAAAPVDLATLLEMRARHTGFGNATWVINQELFTTIAQIKLGDIFALTQGALTGNVDTLMGRPVIWTDLASAPAVKGDIGLCDFSAYQTIVKNNGAVKVDQSMHLKFDTDQMAFRFIARQDGQPMFNSPIIPLNGSDTLSAFVVLNTV